MDSSSVQTPVAEKKPNRVVKKLKKLWVDKKSYPKRLLYSAAVMLAFCFTFLFFGPLEMVAFASESLSYGYQDVVWMLLGTMAAGWVVSSPLIALLRGKIYNYVLCTFLSITVCGYLQGAVFNGQMGALTGNAVAWGDKALEMLGNLLLWIGITVLLYFVMYLSKSVFRKACLGIAVLLVVMQVAPTVLILMGNYEKARVADIKDYSLTDENFYEYGKSDNVFVFVLDRLDSYYINNILRDDPEFFSKNLKGFTQYTNAMSAYARTQPALSHLLSGKENMEYYAYFNSTHDYFKNIWTQNGTDILADLNAAGYEVNLYSDIKNLFADGTYVAANVANASNGESELIPAALLKKLLQLSAYRYAPLALKPFFWADTAYYNRDVRQVEEVNPYALDDAKYLAGFDSATLSADTEKSFRMYHLYGSHSPCTLTEDGTPSTEGETTPEIQTKGVFNKLYEAFARMEELGIYENSTIIITADHGCTWDDTKPVQRATTIGLFLKPAGKGMDDSLKYSHAQVSVQNIPATIIKAVGGDATPYGRALYEIGEDEDVKRTYFKTLSGSIKGKWTEFRVLIYEVIGDANDFSNWKEVSTKDMSSDASFW